MPSKTIIPLRIAILDSDKVSSAVLKTIAETNSAVKDVTIFQNSNDVIGGVDDYGINSIFIDLFTIGIQDGLPFIDHIRKNHPNIPFCLYSKQEQLESLPGVDERWRTRFGHYHKLPKDRNVYQAREELDAELEELSKYLFEHGTAKNTPKIFIVHGHDELSVKELELTLRRIGTAPMIFHQLPKIGSETVIEILERHMRKADAIICLLTPDDEGHKRGSGDPPEIRARQNVWIEAGYAVLSNRKRSLLIALGGVSIPSDFLGIQLVQSASWDSGTGLEVAKRLIEMGLDIDLLGAL